jgi:hypothetical protein
MPVFGSVLFCALVVILAVLQLRHRNLESLHQERMAALEKGAALPMMPGPAPWSPRVYLLRGLIWSLAGVALIVCLYGISSTVSSDRVDSAESKAYAARNLARNLEIPLDQANQIVEHDAMSGRQGPQRSIALLGLIPLAVGLAYLVFYFSDPSRKLSEPRT